MEEGVFVPTRTRPGQTCKPGVRLPSQSSLSEPYKANGEGEETGPRTSPPKAHKMETSSAPQTVALPFRKSPRSQGPPPASSVSLSLSLLRKTSPACVGRRLPQRRSPPSRALPPSRSPSRQWRPLTTLQSVLRRKLPQRRLPITAESTDTRPFNSRENSDPLT